MFFLAQLQKMLMYKTEFIALEEVSVTSWSFRILSDPFGSISALGSKKPSSVSGCSRRRSCSLGVEDKGVTSGMVATVCHLQGSATWCYNLPQVPLLHGATQSYTGVTGNLCWFSQQWKNLPAGGQAVIVHGPHSSIYQSISVSISIYVFFFKCIAIYFVGLKVTTLSPISAMVLPVRALSKRASTRRPKKQVCRMKAWPVDR